MKKITMKDIAKAAGVSAATVSYIMNNAEGQTISSETREKVMRAAQELDYVRNVSARSLKSGKSELIGIVVPEPCEGKPWSSFKHVQAIYRLGLHLNRLGYQPIVLHVDPSSPKLEAILEREMDGAFVFDMAEPDFLRISKRYGLGIPVIAVDCDLSDPLFNKLLPGAGDAFKAACTLLGAEPDYFIMDEYGDPALSALFQKASGLPAGNIHICRDTAGLQRFLENHQGRRGVIANEFVSLAALQADPVLNGAVLCTCGCPELLPEATPKIVFETDAYREAAELLVHYIRHPHETRPPRAILLNPVSP